MRSLGEGETHKQMETRDPPNPDSENVPNTPKPYFGNPNNRSYSHRRAHSEDNFRIPDDLDIVFDGSSASFDDDELFSTFMDLEKIGSKLDFSQSGQGTTKAVDATSCVDQSGDVGGGGGRSESGGGGAEKNVRYTRHRHSNSVDGCTISRESLFGDVMEPKKAMPPDKLEELWTVDPKRAKRILANRQSAARSKERKARYIMELERKVQSLQTEATSLSAQLTLYQRDTTGLAAENTQLKLRLQAMERQAQLRDARNEMLKQEIERLRITTGDVKLLGESLNVGMHHMQYAPSSLFSQQPSVGENQNVPVQQFHYLQSNLSGYPLLTGNSPTFSEFLQQDQLGRFQGLDINSGRASHLVKTEFPLISASKDNITF